MKILAIAAHPDDEVLGCGGLLFSRHSAGDNFKILLLGEGITSRQEKRVLTPEINEQLDFLKRNARACADDLGADDIEFANLPDNRFDSVEFLDIVKIIEKNIRNYSPDIIFTHYGHDLNIDHRICYNAVMTATRPHSGTFVPEIYSFEVPSSTDFIPSSCYAPFQPNFYFSLSEKALEAKLKAYSNYVTEVPEFPHSRSMESLRIYHSKRGIECGSFRAEAFIQVRRVIKDALV